MQLRIGTRKSTLAMAQAEILRLGLLAAHPGLECELVPMLTSGDRETSRPLAEIGGKALFTKELEEGLLARTIDLAVHSLKDMEAHLPQGLVIGAVLQRGDPRDALVSRKGIALAALPAGARVGTSSPRRAAQLAITRPDLVCAPIRGNVTTRLAKLEAGEADAILLALAGLARIDKAGAATEILDADRFLPAAGQGTIAIECRQDDVHVHTLLAAVHDAPTHTAALAERSVLLAIGGTCRTPIGAYARIEDGKLLLDAMFAAPDGSAHARTSREGAAGDAEALGRDAGAELLARGRDWLK